ncbi:MAG TPA: hypothetical protein VH638_08355 [Gemmatimonadaceae bacterium]|jgi:hypothetical protein
MLHQLIGILGALLVLGAYVGLQRGWLTLEHRVYYAMNFVGAGLLTWIAATERQVGLTLVEGAWAALSVPGLLRPQGRGSGAKGHGEGAGSTNPP